MHGSIQARRDEVAVLCRRFGVVRLDVFGSAARGDDFDPDRSDADLLVTFAADREPGLAAFLDFKAAMEGLLGRRVDLVERPAVERSRNTIRRRNILNEAQPIYAA